MNGQQDGTGGENATETGDSAPTDSEALSNRFPETDMRPIIDRFNRHVAELCALLPDPRTTTEVPF